VRYFWGMREGRVTQNGRTSGSDTACVLAWAVGRGATAVACVARRRSIVSQAGTSYAQATHKRRRPVALRDGLASASSTACLRVLVETASQ
jgi:hypothetical protein